VQPDVPVVVAPLPTAAQVAVDIVRRDLALAPTGAKGETLSRMSATLSGATVLSTGRLSLVACYLPTGALISSITFVAGSQAAVTPTAQWFALYNSARGLLAQTVDDTTTSWAANAAKTLSIASPFTTTYSGLYYLGVMVAAGTVPSLNAVTVPSDATALVPIISGTSTTGLTTTAPATADALTALTRVPYAYAS
jgi:hypothetical protein